MNVKNELLNLKRNLLRQPSKERMVEKKVDSIPETKVEWEKVLYRKNIDLNLKIEQFLDWYVMNMSEMDVSNLLIRNQEKKQLNQFIEKMVIWYELRYPNYELDRLFDDGDSSNHRDISKIMFQDNEVVEDGILDLKWADFYNAQCFIRSLTKYEKEYIERPKYPGMIYLPLYRVKDSFNGYIYGSFPIYLTSTGKIVKIILDSELGKDKRKIIGMSLKEFVTYLKERGDIFFLSDGFEKLENCILQYENKKYSKERIFDCVMYRMIERGGFFYGPCRAYLFAKEFQRDLSIPIQYAMDSSGYLDKLFHCYLQDGGNFDLECYVDYFDKSNYEKMTTMTIREYFKKHNFYTMEETKLHQRLVNSFATYQEKLTPVEERIVLQKRLERKLKKAHCRK